MEINCPGCKKKVKWEGNRWRPFCSERCKMIDLGGWASEKFKVEQKSIFDESELESSYLDDKID